ncbi:ABC transporter ATP-binding protein [Streptomyces sp. RPT161]|uniref:ABC transporter ATP-binding protein n=1 Tax=Streptomyces sp. RPT161 TaxID=3015993 RepID=UPI0022B8E32F|nr:ATP-binding cassette domain-containing protein [Streptomyces sp. RPT161]
MTRQDPARFDGFTKTFGTTTAVEDLTFALRCGRILGLLGSNGAGKSTSLRGLLGLIHPTSGTATVFGVPYGELAHPARQVGVSMDGMGFVSHLSGRRNLLIAARAADLAASRVDAVLDQVGLTDSAGRKVKGYSTGMRQRLSIAAALLGDPELLVLDEPANGMDPEGIRWLRTLLRSLADEGRTVLVSSHQLAELEQTVDDVAVLQRRLLFCGSLAQLTEDGSSRLEEKFFELTATPVSGAAVA